MLNDDVFMLFFLPALSQVPTHTHHKERKLVTDQQTAKSSSTDATTNYPWLGTEYQID